MKLTERFEFYFNTLQDKTLLKEKETIFKQLERMKIQEKSFNEDLDKIKLNIDLIKSRIKELENYDLVDKYNKQDLEIIIARYKKMLDLYRSKFKELQEYEKLYNEVVMLHNETV